MHTTMSPIDWAIIGIYLCGVVGLGVFLLGVFWKRASGKSAFLTLIAGMALGFVAFYLDWNNIYRGDFMLIAFLLLVVCLVIMVATTLMLPEALKPEATTHLGGLA